MRGTWVASAKRGAVMNHERLEWIISGLSRYKLTEKENQFVKSAEVDFNQKNKLTEQQEEKLENLYKEKSRFLPNKNYFSFKESVSSEKTKARKFRPKFMP
jgi:DNA repair ATPase RecN